MVDVIASILGASASQSFVQYTSCIVTVLGFVWFFKCLSKIFDI